MYTTIVTIKHTQFITLQSGLDTIINTCDLMQNLGQTWIIFKPDETHLTRTKHDRDELTQFQPYPRILWIVGI